MAKTKSINSNVYKIISAVLILASLLLCFLPVIKIGEKTLNLFNFFIYTFTGSFGSSDVGVYFDHFLLLNQSFKTLIIIMQVVSFLAIILTIVSLVFLILSIFKKNKYFKSIYNASWLVTTLLYILGIIMVYWFGNTLTYYTVTTLLFVPMLVSLLNVFVIIFEANNN